LSEAWGQQVVVVNQPGAGGSLAARAAAGSTPDGTTLFMAVSSAFVTMKGAAPNIPIEVPGDFAESWNQAFELKLCSDKIQDLLLANSQVLHTGQLSSAPAICQPALSPRSSPTAKPNF